MLYRKKIPSCSEVQRFLLRSNIHIFSSWLVLHFWSKCIMLQSNTSNPWEALPLLNWKHFPFCSEAQRFLLYITITLYILGSTSLLKKIYSTTNQYINFLENSKWDALLFLHWSTTLSTMHFFFPLKKIYSSTKQYIKLIGSTSLAWWESLPFFLWSTTLSVVQQKQSFLGSTYFWVTCILLQSNTSSPWEAHDFLTGKYFHSCSKV